MPSERKTITIQAFTEVKTSARGRQYWTLQDMEQTTYVCFIPSLRECCHIGTTIDAELEPPLNKGDSPRLANIYVGGKPIYQAEEKTTTTRRAYGKSDKELAQIKELAEAQKRSIERQVSAKLACEISSDNESLEVVLRKADQIYKWIVGKARQPSSDEPLPRVDEIPQEIPVKDVKTLMAWALSHGKQFTPSFVGEILEIKAPKEILDMPRAYDTIKEKMNW